MEIRIKVESTKMVSVFRLETLQIQEHYQISQEENTQLAPIVSEIKEELVALSKTTEKNSGEIRGETIASALCSLVKCLET